MRLRRLSRPPDSKFAVIANKGIFFVTIVTVYRVRYPISRNELGIEPHGGMAVDYEIPPFQIQSDATDVERKEE
ncbi:MAG: hypothetical protein KDA87_10040 [Planctomycetales bacterium]|nr:hypothetical protein [Planctomycetales bacterium]